MRRIWKLWAKGLGFILVAAILLLIFQNCNSFRSTSSGISSSSLQPAAALGPTTVVDLKANLLVPPIGYYYVLGYTKPGDGGEGTFIFKPSDSTSADNGGTMIVDAAGHRFSRSFSDNISVKWFGATGDGTTDDTVTFANAIAAGTGYAVYVPKGTYNLATAENIFLKDLKLYGDGVSVNTFGGPIDTSNGSIILISSQSKLPFLVASNVTVDSLTFAYPLQIFSATKGTWTQSAAYQAGDTVLDGASGWNSGVYYRCVTGHTSGTWAADIANGYWRIVPPTVYPPLFTSNFYFDNKAWSSLNTTYSNLYLPNTYRFLHWGGPGNSGPVYIDHVVGTVIDRVVWIESGGGGSLSVNDSVFSYGQIPNFGAYTGQNGSFMYVDSGAGFYKSVDGFSMRRSAVDGYRYGLNIVSGTVGLSAISDTAFDGTATAVNVQGAGAFSGAITNSYFWSYVYTPVVAITPGYDNATLLFNGTGNNVVTIEGCQFYHSQGNFIAVISGVSNLAIGGNIFNAWGNNQFNNRWNYAAIGISSPSTTISIFNNQFSSASNTVGINIAQCVHTSTSNNLLGGSDSAIACPTN